MRISHTLLSVLCTQDHRYCSPLCACRPLLLGRGLGVQARFWGCRQADPGGAHAQPGGTTEKAPEPQAAHLQSCKLVRNLPIPNSLWHNLTFLSARNICIFHPLLNEPHLSTIDHSYPSIIKTNILQISYVSASLRLQFCPVPIFYSTPSLIILELTVP